MVLASRLGSGAALVGQHARRAGDQQRAARRVRSTRRHSGPSRTSRVRRSSASATESRSGERGIDELFGSRPSAIPGPGGGRRASRGGRSAAQIVAGRRQRLHHRQGRLHPDEQPRRRRRDRDRSHAAAAMDDRRRATGQGRRPRRAHRQRAPAADGDAGQPLPRSKFGDSAQIAPGDWVMAIGNPFSLVEHGDGRRRQRGRPSASGRRSAASRS